jgi:hypothetical protein
VTINFQWSGDGGYTARGSFSYDQKTAPTILREKGAGKMRILKDFQVSFYDLKGQEIAKYNNVKDGFSQTNYFQFNFNTKTGQVFGAIDLGGESSGETYLKGIVNDNLALFRVEGGDLVMDEDNSPEIITQSFP